MTLNKNLTNTREDGHLVGDFQLRSLHNLWMELKNQHNDLEGYHWLNGHEFGQAPGFGDGQGSLACCSPWGHKELDMTDRLNWTELNWVSPRGFPGSSAGKESACNAGDSGSIPGLGRFSGGGHGNPLQYSCLENPHGQRNLEAYSPWGGKELDTTEWLGTAQDVLEEELCKPRPL